MGIHPRDYMGLKATPRATLPQHGGGDVACGGGRQLPGRLAGGISMGFFTGKSWELMGIYGILWEFLRDSIGEFIGIYGI